MFEGRMPEWMTDDEVIQMAEMHYEVLRKKIAKFEHGHFLMNFPGNKASAVVIVANCKIKQIEIEYEDLAVMRSIRPG